MPLRVKSGSRRGEKTYLQRREDLEKRLAEDFEESPAGGQYRTLLERIDALRKPGVSSVEECRRRIAQEKQDHELQRRFSSIDAKRKKAADKREYLRGGAAAQAELKERKTALKKLTKEVEKEGETAISHLVSKGADPIDISSLERELEDFPKIRKGLREALSWSRLEEEKKAVFADVSFRREDPSLEPFERRIVAREETIVTEAFSSKERIRQSLEEILRRNVAHSDRTEVEALVSLLEEASLLAPRTKLSLARKDFPLERRKRREDFRILRRQRKEERREKLAWHNNDAGHKIALEQLHKKLGEALAIQRANREEIASLVRSGEAVLSSYFEGAIRTATLSSQGGKPNEAEGVSDVTGAIGGGCLAEETLSRVRVAALKRLWEGKRERLISPAVRASKKNAYREAERDYFAPEEVAEDPSLVDAHAMRLVIDAKKAGGVKEAERRDFLLHVAGQVFVYLFLIAFGIVVLFPFYWMLITSLKSNMEIRNSSSPAFYPGASEGYPVAWSNYAEVFQNFDFGTYLGNTLAIGFGSTALVLLTCILSAFAFARLRFKGRDALFTLFLATMMIPGEMMVITNYITVSTFGWVGTGQTRLQAYLAMIVPFSVSVFYMYLLRQNFKQIPEELYLAAKVDGKSDWRFLWDVMVPLCRPTLITIGILQLMGAWNAYVWPNLITSDDSFRLISNGLRNSFQTTTGEPEYGYQMAATVLVTVPLLAMFLGFRKYIMKGVGRAGIKG